MDDVLTGADTIEGAQELQNQVIQLCRAGGFPLKKWASNCEELLETIPEEDRMQCDTRAWKPEEISHSILGLRWNPMEDCFAFLTPVIIKAKIIIQTAWLLGLDWNDPLPNHEAAEWTRLREDLSTLTQVKIQRTLQREPRSSSLALHGFADASERAYAAVLYLQSRHKDGHAVTSLITAKRHPSKWKTYVANRVVEIQRLTPEAHWNYLPGDNNPADCASRGLYPSDLEAHQLWWEGPIFLREATVRATNQPRHTNGLRD
ncbi:uncharacterized protein [Polyergus mexicanus]|uniref:uncharacterized protein n=1 Tax=Polyergus mexicanus TaxID=615972 RepID=UPI0038B4A411